MSRRIQRKRQHSAGVLEEAFNTLSEVQRGIRDDAMDAIALKVSKFGGLTPSPAQLAMGAPEVADGQKIGRASCRERV